MQFPRLDFATIRHQAHELKGLARRIEAASSGDAYGVDRVVDLADQCLQLCDRLEELEDGIQELAHRMLHGIGRNNEPQGKLQQ